MKTFIEKVLVVLLGFPIGGVIFLLIAGIATLLFPVYAIGKGIELIIKLFNKDYTSEIADTFLEFIFVMYGFSSLFLLLPIAALEPNVID